MNTVDQKLWVLQQSLSHDFELAGLRLVKARTKAAKARLERRCKTLSQLFMQVSDMSLPL